MSRRKVDLTVWLKDRGQEQKAQLAVGLFVCEKIDAIVSCRITVVMREIVTQDFQGGTFDIPVRKRKIAARKHKMLSCILRQTRRDGFPQPNQLDHLRLQLNQFRRPIGNRRCLFRRNAFHLRRHVHAAELGAAHAAEVGVFEAFGRQRFVVIGLGCFGVE
jgi:hypothetical protein